MASSLMEREPALVTGGLVALASAVITAAHAFRWIAWTPEQSGAVAAVMVIVLPPLQGWITRRYVRPAARSLPVSPATPPLGGSTPPL